MFLVVSPRELVMRPVSNVPPCVGRHFFPLDEYAYRFEGEHFPWLRLFGTILRNTEFCGMIANAFQLCLPA
jgi:hypothetical protein